MDLTIFQHVSPLSWFLLLALGAMSVWGRRWARQDNNRVCYSYPPPCTSSPVNTYSEDTLSTSLNTKISIKHPRTKDTG